VLDGLARRDVTGVDRRSEAGRVESVEIVDGDGVTLRVGRPPCPGGDVVLYRPDRRDRTMSTCTSRDAPGLVVHRFRGASDGEHLG
jgi:hypothetical protein